MRTFFSAMAVMALVAIVFDYGLDRLGYSSADQHTSASVRLGE